MKTIFLIIVGIALFLIGIFVIAYVIYVNSEIKMSVEDTFVRIWFGGTWNDNYWHWCYGVF
jgi:hypothetical protein